MSTINDYFARYGNPEATSTVTVVIPLTHKKPGKIPGLKFILNINN
jgi:hypothetical protein